MVGVKGCAVLTARRFPRKLLRERIEQVEVAQPEPRSLEAVLADAEPTLRFAYRSWFILQTEALYQNLSQPLASQAEACATVIRSIESFLAMSS